MAQLTVDRGGQRATTVLLTVVALLAFAGNSILCRLALGASSIDAASYTAVRLISGALALWLIEAMRGNFTRISGSGKSWWSGALLFVYAIAFAYAYRSLSAGTGALILFAAVQLTMIGTALRLGEGPAVLDGLGWGAAMMGLVYLVFPGITAPSVGGSLLMMVAGVAWGAYSLLGRGGAGAAADPIQATSENFLYAVPWVLLAVVIQWPRLSVTPVGLLWATLSGAVTSGLGYVIWYAALGRISATRAATVQLAVPLIAVFGGVVLLSETLTARTLVAATAILGGIGLTLCARHSVGVKFR